VALADLCRRALAEHVTKPAIDYFNKIANGEMEIELFYADQIVPTGELFQAMQRGTIDAVHSDDDSMASPTEVTPVRRLLPVRHRYSSTCRCCSTSTASPISGLRNTRRSASSTWISAAGQDPCNFNTKKDHVARRSRRPEALHLPDRRPLPGAVRRRAGHACPTRTPRSRCRPASSTACAWSGITEDYTVGWADVTDYFLTNNISGAWIGSFFANQERWNELPDHLKQLSWPAWSRPLLPQPVVLGRRGKLRVNGDKLQLPPSRQRNGQVEDAAKEFWDEIAEEGETKKKVVDIFREVQRGHQPGRPAIPLRLSPAFLETGRGAPGCGPLQRHIRAGAAHLTKEITR
jgi:hypothetical protein